MIQPRAVLAAVVAAACLVSRDGAAAPRVKAGVFLYASPTLTDPRFAESVVLLVQHGVEGSMGRIVNRPTRVSVREAVKDLAETRGLELRLYWGGPVQPEVALALVRSPKRLASAQRVLPDVQLSAEPDQWKSVARGPEASSRLRVYSGYAGWSPGQLAQEMRRGSWVVGPADAASVFSSDPAALWPRVHDLMQRIEARSPVIPGEQPPAAPGAAARRRTCAR
jgi:putative transcriptional regulator